MDRYEGQDPPLYNSRLVDNYLRFLGARYPEVSIQEILEYSGIKSYEVSDQGHWFTQRQINRFQKIMRELTDSPKIAREAGRYSASPNTLGLVRALTLGILGPGKFFEVIGRTTQNLTRSANYRSRRIHANKYEVTVTPHPGVSESDFQCENRKGFFEALVSLFRYELVSLEHPECIFSGGKSCRYIISWEKSSFAFWRDVQLAATGVFTFLAISSALVGQPQLALIKFLSGVVVFFGFGYLSKIFENRELSSTLNQLNATTTDAISKINLNYDNAVVTREISQLLTKQTTPAEIFRHATNVLEKRLDYDRGQILIAEGGHLKYKAGFGFNAEQEAFLAKTTYSIDKPSSTGTFYRTYHEKTPFLIEDVSKIKSEMSEKSFAVIEKLNVKSFLTCPILFEGSVLGIMAIENLHPSRPFVQSDISFLMGIANFLGISLRNANLLEAKAKQFASISRVLAATIDARDPLTAGHSETVMEYSLGICREMGQSEEFCEVIKVAAALHDYGKIGIPDAILKKPGRLTPGEYRLVQEHAAKTRMILEQIEFEGAYQDVPEVAGAHHEKFDGTGYPQGLRGEQIPLGARIIAVADFFEALTSERHYRNPLPLTDVLAMVREKSGAHFDPQVVDALLRMAGKNGIFSKKNLSNAPPNYTGLRPTQQISGE